MLKLINDRDVMGPYVNSRWTNVLAWGTALVLILLTLLLLFMSLMP
ncbi:MAG: hypothetical protein HY347_09265 [candidate division NC10 bacterium]|nr:hypothetical protein [candidate division NC10 bacterium]